MSYKFSKPRLSIEIEEEQHFKLRELIPHGLKTAIFRVIVEELIEIFEDEQTREKFMGLIMNRTITIKSLLEPGESKNDAK